MQRFTENFSHSSISGSITGNRRAVQYPRQIKKLVRGYVQLVAHYAGHEETLQELADQYLHEEAEKRASNISAVKSFEAFRAWVTIESGFYTEYQMPDGTSRKEPKSISFAKNGRY